MTQLKELYNTGATVYLVDHEPNVVASLLKLFLRELPEPVLTTKLVPKFEQASGQNTLFTKNFIFYYYSTRCINNNIIIIIIMIS